MVEAKRRLVKLDQEKGREWLAFKRNAANKGKGFDDFEADWNDNVAQRDLFGDLHQKAQAIVGRQGAPQAPRAPQAPQAPGRTGTGVQWRVVQ